MPRYYGMFVDVRGRRCVVFGGDAHEGQRKALYLHECGAEVTLFSPEEETAPRLIEMASAGDISWVKRKYVPGDLKGAWIAIVADTSDVSVNEAISAEASRRNVLLNVMDVTHLCTFIAPALIHREDITVAVSTAGTSPALARRLRERMSDQEYCQCLQWADLGPILKAARRDIRARHLPVSANDWADAITDQMLQAFQSGDQNLARQMLMDALEKHATR